jgi:hypothetical protein
MLQSDEANLPLRKYLFNANFSFDSSVYSASEISSSAYNEYMRINSNNTIQDYMNFMVRKINMGEGMVLQNIGGVRDFRSF